MSGREAIMARIRAALADVPDLPADQDVPVPWAYGRPTPMPDVVGRFVEVVRDYRASAVRVGPGQVGDAVLDALRASGAGSAVVPAGLPTPWRQALLAGGVRLVEDDPPLSHEELNRVDAVVTAAAGGVAETGTIIVDHAADQGRRALTLVPDVHVCVVRADQVVSDVAEAVARLARAGADRRPQTWISGPSATSDIELDRVEGVHGPRTLCVVVIEAG